MESSCLQDINEIRTALSRREQLLRCNDVPMQSELYKSLGDSLGHIVVNNMDILSKELMGITDPLKGPPKNLWVPPASRVDNKQFLIPPSPVDVTKAFLHQSILEIGEKFEAKVEESCLERIKKATSDLSEFERFECERRLNFALECQHRKHLQELKNMKEVDKSELLILQNALHDEYLQGREEYIVKHQSNSDEIVVERQDQGIQTVSIELHENDDGHLIKLAKRQKQLNRAIKSLWEDFKEHLKIQRHILTCTRVTEVMHVICAQKLDAQQKIRKMKELCNEEINRIAGNNGYKLIKDKYLGLMKNIKDLVELAIADDIERKDVLAQFQNQIERDMIEIGFEENLCFCCQDAKKLMQMSPSQDEKLHVPAAVVIYPKTDGEKIFCTCHSTSEEEDMELQRRLIAQVAPKEQAHVHWSTESDSSMKSGSYSTSNKTTSEVSIELPLNSDLHLAKRIAGIINIEDILVNAFQQVNGRHLGNVSNEILQNKIFDYVSEEFHRKFNRNTVLTAISNVTNKREQRFIMGARDSLEILERRWSTVNDEFLTIGESEAPTQSTSTSTPETINGTSDSGIKTDDDLKNMEENSEKQPENPSVEVHKDVIRLSRQHRSCWKDYADIKETNSKNQISDKQFMESLVYTPKYMKHPESKVDSNWIYRKRTKGQWDAFMEKFRTDMGKEDSTSSSSSIECGDTSSENNTADPELLDRVINAYRDCAKTSHPLGKMRVRSLIDMLEQNEEITKLIYKNKRLRNVRKSDSYICKSIFINDSFKIFPKI